MDSTKQDFRQQRLSLAAAVRNSTVVKMIRHGLRRLQVGTSLQRMLAPNNGACPEVVPLSDDPVLLPLPSTLCTQAFIESPVYAEWCQRFGHKPVYHRKQWEFVYICQALYENGALQPGKQGLGFGVGREPLGSLFAKLGCKLVLTDMAHEEASKQGWADTNQHANALEQLHYKHVCDAQTFLDASRFEIVDMNDIPKHLTGFDFCWSSCALEHLGSIENGLRFIKNSIKCLNPGGIAVHTTEYNISSNRSTLDNAATVLFRKRDLLRLQEELHAEGHVMRPLVLDPGTAVLDDYVDVPPYRDDKHLKLALWRYVATSVGVIVQKGEDGH